MGYVYTAEYELALADLVFLRQLFGTSTRVNRKTNGKNRVHDLRLPTYLRLMCVSMSHARCSCNGFCILLVHFNALNYGERSKEMENNLR